MNSRSDEIMKYYLRNYLVSSDIYKSSTDQLLDISAIMGIPVEKYMNYKGKDYEINLVLGPFNVQRKGNRNKPCLQECEIDMIDMVKKYCRYEPRPVADRNRSKPKRTAEAAQSNQRYTNDDVLSSEAIVPVPDNSQNNTSLPNLTVKPSIDAKTDGMTNEVSKNKKRRNRKNKYKQSEKCDNQTTAKENTIKILSRPKNDMAIQLIPENSLMLGVSVKPILDAKTDPVVNEIPETKNMKRKNRKNENKQTEKFDNQTTVKENTIKILSRPKNDVAIQLIRENSSMLDVSVKPILDAKTGPVVNEIPKTKNKKRKNRKNENKQSEKSDNQTMTKENIIKILPRPKNDMAIQLIPENSSMLDVSVKPILDAKTGSVINEIPETKNKKRRSRKNKNKQSEKFDNQTMTKENIIKILPRPQNGSNFSGL